jgi:hypothetical protein
MRAPERGRRQPARRGVSALALGAALALFAACGDEETPPARRTSASQPAPAARRSEEPRLRVERDGAGSFRVRARGAPRIKLLEEIARLARFAIVPGPGGAVPGRLDLELEGASVEEVLERILADVPHHLHYEAGAAEGGEVALRRLTVGALPPSAAAPPAAGTPRRAGARSGKRPGDERPGRAGGPEERARSEEERLAEIEAGRDSRFADERAAAAALMRAEENLPELLALLAEDPSAEVRGNAAAALGEAEGGETAYRAADALLGALGDGDPAVVAAAVASLEELYDVIPDPRIRAGVEPLARHADPRVRAAVASFREWVEDEP